MRRLDLKARSAFAWRVSVIAASLAIASCGSNETPTSPTDSTTGSTTTTAASPVFSEDFIGTLDADGSSFYSFSVTQYGTVNVTLTSVGGTFVPSGLQLGLGLGTPSGTDCSTTQTITTRSGPSPQLTGTYQPGVYCVRVYDVGNVFGAANFAVTIAYP
jgi:hypothetical protein